MPPFGRQGVGSDACSRGRTATDALVIRTVTKAPFGRRAQPVHTAFSMGPGLLAWPSLTRNGGSGPLQEYS